MSNIRVRYPPSPTGEPHLGNIRTALFNWLFAKNNKGKFILRVEDTDRNRLVEGAMESQLEALKWLGIDWDEGPDIGGAYKPYTQSERLDIYKKISDRLIQDGFAYKCYCSQERLAQMREGYKKNQSIVGYDRKCRNINPLELGEINNEKPYVVRFKTPLEGKIIFNDLVRGQVEFENIRLDDFVILKSDGFPTYHLANVIDDYYMKITHVMRAEEWLSSTPKHIHIYNSMNWEIPEFVHLPIILAPDKSKLSKRHGATSILEYRRLGYLPNAMVNFLAKLGWSLDGETEKIETSELISNFSLKKVSKSGAIFDIDKLNWLNGVYIRELTADELTFELLDYWKIFPSLELPANIDYDLLKRIVPLISERIKTLNDVGPLISYFFSDTVKYKKEQILQKGLNFSDVNIILEKLYSEVIAIDDFESNFIETNLRNFVSESNYKTGQVLGILRVIYTGLDVAPPLFESMEILGKKHCVSVISRAIDNMKSS